MTTRLLNILVTTVLLIALCSPSRAQESKNSSSVIRKFTALLNVQIPPELEQYAAEGIVHLDGTAINIIQKSLNDVFTAKDSMSRPAGSDRLLYTLLVLENFRNENRISRSLLPEYMIADSNPAAQQYKISADNLFEESSVAIISAYRAEIAEIEKNKLKQASPNVGQNLTTALTTSPQYANANPPKAKPRTSTTTSRDVTNADILSTENRIWIIEERAKNTDKQLDDLDQKKQIINNITIDIHGKQKPTTPKTTTKKTKKQTKNKRISAIEQRAQKSENRLVKIERRVDDSERQIEKMIVAKQSGQQYALKNRKKEEASPSSPPSPPLQHRYVRVENTPRLPVVQISLADEENQSPTFNNGHSEEIIVGEINNVYNPTTKNLQCSVNCEAVERWLMDWYEQYTRYSDRQKMKSKLPDAIKDIKNRYDRDRVPYTRTFKSLLDRFGLLSDN